MEQDHVGKIDPENEWRRWSKVGSWTEYTPAPGMQEEVDRLLALDDPPPETWHWPGVLWSLRAGLSRPRMNPESWRLVLAQVREQLGTGPASRYGEVLGEVAAVQKAFKKASENVLGPAEYWKPGEEELELEPLYSIGMPEESVASLRAGYVRDRALPPGVLSDRLREALDLLESAQTEREGHENKEFARFQADLILTSVRAATALRMERAMIADSSQGPRDTSTNVDATAGRIAHAPDFSWVTASDGIRYDFQTTRQRQIVAALFPSWKVAGNGAGMTESALIDQTGAAVTRLRVAQIFEGTAALGTILRSPSKGIWALYLTLEPQINQR